MSSSDSESDTPEAVSSTHARQQLQSSEKAVRRHLVDAAAARRSKNRERDQRLKDRKSKYLDPALFESAFESEAGTSADTDSDDDPLPSTSRAPEAKTNKIVYEDDDTLAIDLSSIDSGRRRANVDSFVHAQLYDRDQHVRDMARIAGRNVQKAKRRGLTGEQKELLGLGPSDAEKKKLAAKDKKKRTRQLLLRSDGYRRGGLGRMRPSVAAFRRA